MQPLRRPSATARVHRLVEQPAHLVGLGVGGFAGLGRLQPHHIGDERRQRHVRQHVDPLGRALDAIEKLREALPIPGHPGLHRGIGNRFVARHGQHRAVAILGMAGGEAKSAVADDHRGNAVPTRDRAIGIPEQRRIVMGMKIDEARRHVHPGSVDDLGGLMLLELADLGDTAVLDSDIAFEARHPGTVDDGPAPNNGVEFRHCLTLVSPAFSGTLAGLYQIVKLRTLLGTAGWRSPHETDLQTFPWQERRGGRKHFCELPAQLPALRPC